MYPYSGTIRTSTSFVPALDDRTPRMPFLALPPRVFAASRSDHFGRNVTVVLGMPLGGERGIRRGKVVVPGHYLVPITARASAPVRTSADRRFPIMSAATNPPHLFGAMGGDHVGRQVAILFVIPFGNERWVRRCEVSQLLTTKVAGLQEDSACGAPPLQLVQIQQACHTVLPHGIGPPVRGRLSM